MSLRTGVGWVKLEVWHGKDPGDNHWGCPVRERWGLKAHQELSPALEEKLAFTATLARTYEGAAQLASKWGCAVDDSLVHAVVQRVGSRAEEQTQARLKQPPQEQQPRRGASELAVLMVDGWYARFRGPGWGKKRTQQERVEWHELKTGIFYLHEQAARTEAGRGVIVDKRLVRWQGEPLELGRWWYQDAPGAPNPTAPGTAAINQAVEPRSCICSVGKGNCGSAALPEQSSPAAPAEASLRIQCSIRASTLPKSIPSWVAGNLWRFV